MTKIRDIGEKIFSKVVPKQIKPQVFDYSMLICTKLEKMLLNEGRDLPLIVDIETNSKCTRDCSYCSRMPNNETELEEEVFYSVIDQLKEWGFKGRVSPHAFNEPLTDPRIFKFLSYVRETLPDNELILYTNGDLLDSSRLERIIDCDVNRVRVTLHEPTTDEQFKRISLLSKDNDIIHIMDFREEYRQHPLSNRGGTIDLGLIKKPKACYLNGILSIRATGDVALCCNDSQLEHIFGNVKEEPIESIWNNSEYSRIRQEVRKGKYKLPICQKCGYEAVV